MFQVVHERPSDSQFKTNRILSMQTSSLIALSLLVTVIAYIYYYLKPVFNYWKDRGVPHETPIAYFKNMTNLLLGRVTFYELQNTMYNSLRGHRFGGYYNSTEPVLFVCDPELIERVIITDFNHFVDRGFTNASEDHVIFQNLTNAEGDRWRAMRYKLTPTFTSSKLKGMFGHIERACDDLIRYVDEESANGDGQLDGKPLMNRFGTNVIASCAFGIDFSYRDKERDRLQSAVRKLMAPSVSQILRLYALIFCPRIFKLLHINIIDPEIVDYFGGLVNEVFRCRKENKNRRNDLLQLLLELKETEDNEVRVRPEEAAENEPEDAVIDQMHHVLGQEEKSWENYKSE